MFDKLKTRKALFFYGISAISAAVLCVILRTLSIFFSFNIEIGYYKSGAPLPIILNVLMFVAVLAAFAFCFIPKIKIVSNEPFSIRSVKMSAIFPAVGFAAYTFVYVSWLMDYLKFYPTLPLSYLICAVAGVGACAFFACIALRKKNCDVVFVLLGILTIVWLVLSLAECYFDTLVQMNSPNKLVFQFACLSAMLLVVNEMRQDLDVKKANFHLFSASVALLFLLTSSVPSIICAVARRMPISYSLIYSDAVFLLLAAFAAVRLVQLCFIEPPVVKEEITEYINEEIEEVMTENTEDVSEVTDTETDTENPSDESKGENDERE